MAALQPLAVPAQLLGNVEFCKQLADVLKDATELALPADFGRRLPAAACLPLLKRGAGLLGKEPTCVHVAPPPGAEVVVVGDLHGQFHDLYQILSTVGTPGDGRVWIFDGDFVDRGPWGLEIMLLLSAWKAVAPKHVYLVRGNHETAYCSWVYGFRAEVLAKFEVGAQGEAVFKQCQSLFARLPLAAVVASRTLVLHGGLPRAPPRRVTRRSLPAEVAIASLAEIAASSKGGADPDPEFPDQRLAADVLWSDPCSEPGIQLGARPGDVGVLFGPDVTESFLRDNGLRCILRGHEGPDARELRPDMRPMGGGWTLDHNTPAGRLYTVFSAPRYCQQFDNLGAVAVLSGPGFDVPRFVQFEAAPRPEHAVLFGAISTDDEVALGQAAAAAAEAAAAEDAKAASSEASSSDEEDEEDEERVSVSAGGSSEASSGTEGEEGEGAEQQQQQQQQPTLAAVGAAGGSAEGYQGSGSSEAAAAVQAAAAAGAAAGVLPAAVPCSCGPTMAPPADDAISEKAQPSGSTKQETSEGQPESKRPRLDDGSPTPAILGPGEPEAVAIATNY